MVAVVLLQGDTPEQVAGMVVALEVYTLPVEEGSLQQWVGLVAVLVADNLKKLCHQQRNSIQWLLVVCVYVYVSLVYICICVCMCLCKTYPGAVEDMAWQCSELVAGQVVAQYHRDKDMVQL